PYAPGLLQRRIRAGLRMQIYAVLGGLARPLDSLVGMPFGLWRLDNGALEGSAARSRKMRSKRRFSAHAGCWCRRALSQVPLAPRIRSSRNRADYESDSQRIVGTHFSTLLG